MDGLLSAIDFVANNIFNEVAILIGLITAIGLILQRSAVEDVVAGTLRSMVGVFALLIGIDVFVGGLEALQTIVAGAFGLDPPVAQNTMDGFLSEWGGTVALTLAFGFLLHLVLVRVLRTRFIYLTGHLLFWTSFMAVASTAAVFPDSGQLPHVVAAGTVAAVYWTMQPLLLAPMMARVVQSQAWGFAHTSAFTAWLGGASGKLLGSTDPKQDIERVRVPKRLSFFKDVNVSTALVIGIIMLTAIAFADSALVGELAAEYNPDMNIWVWGVVSALRFATGIAILLFGVRMFLAEIVPAFKGISDKAIKDARPGLDVPTIFPFGPTALMIGFVSTTGTFLIIMAIVASAGWFVLIPPMIPLFFVGAAAGIFGNVHGGWRGAVIGGILTGLFLAVAQWVTWGMLASTAPELATFLDPDHFLIAWLIIGLGTPLEPLGDAGLYIIAAIVLALGVVITLLVRKRLLSKLDQWPTGEQIEPTAAAAPTASTAEAPGMEGGAPPQTVQTRTETLQVLAVCGVGMGSSMILKMNAERALSDLGIDAKVQNADVSSARGMDADVVIAQPMHMEELSGMRAQLIPVTDFVDVNALRNTIAKALADDENNDKDNK